MDTAAIETFLAVAYGKNMTAVSKQLFVSQSTISLAPWPPGRRTR